MVSDSDRVAACDTTSDFGWPRQMRSSGSPSISSVNCVQRLTPSYVEYATNGSFWRACSSPTAVTPSSSSSRKYSVWYARPAVGKSKRVEPTFVTAPPLGLCRNASPMHGKSIAFDVQLMAYRFVSRLPFVSPSASAFVRLLSPTDMTLR